MVILTRLGVEERRCRAVFGEREVAASLRGRASRVGAGHGRRRCGLLGVGSLTLSWHLDPILSNIRARSGIGQENCPTEGVLAMVVMAPLLDMLRGTCRRCDCCLWMGVRWCWWGSEGRSLAISAWISCCLASRSCNRSWSPPREESNSGLDMLPGVVWLC